jgi:hypothetical protein
MRFAIAVLLVLGIFATANAQPTQPVTACNYLAGLVPADGARLFLPSYPTAEDGPLRGTAFLYDNAVAAIALVGCGEAGRARHIGDAILAALDHDRAWKDGRLRNAYAAGSVGEVPVKLGGWWDKGQNRWVEDRYQVSSDSGNMAWAMLALLALDRAGQGPTYRAGAVRIGDWVARQADSRGAGGYAGGRSGWEPSPGQVQWKSTEHNTDLAAAFALLGKTTGEPIWGERAQLAARFVAAMWDDRCGCFRVGTSEDGVTPNRALALDAQLWPLLAISGLAAAHGEAVITTVGQKLRGGNGYTYSDAGGGLWTEGSAQAALTMKLLGHGEAAAALATAVAGERAPQGGYFATAEATMPTGFAEASDPAAQRLYFRIPHLAAAAWAALAETGFNPFTAARGLP